MFWGVQASSLRVVTVPFNALTAFFAVGEGWHSPSVPEPPGASA